MSLTKQGESEGARVSEDRVGRNIGVGCFTFFIGGVSGGMTGVLIGKLVSFFTRAPACEGVPLCNWYVFAGYGALVGALSLPVFAIWRLRRADLRSDGAAADSSNRG
ncbi:MAG TPA: hypothetical protein VE869_04555 [Gemmatimonas sp.]|nr:hypothetical protein [Gemmatimonas sp.]